jgi:DNA-directed RNA polymerase subunit N (RpoN/RPB10)
MPARKWTIRPDVEEDVLMHRRLKNLGVHRLCCRNQTGRESQASYLARLGSASFAEQLVVWVPTSRKLAADGDHTFTFHLAGV